MHPAATTRLAFRTWRDDDLPLARALFGDPRVTAFIGGPLDDVQVHARLARELATQREHGFQYWPVFLHDGTHVGCCGLKPRDAVQRQFSLGFYLRAEHWGQGYAVEAGHSVIAFTFDALGAALLFARHHPDNTSSRRALEKLGFRLSHHELHPTTGLMHPGYELLGPNR